MTIDSSLYCCVWLKNALAEVGDKGFGVMAVSGERRLFYLEAKPFDSAIDRKYSTRDASGRSRWPLLTDDEGLEVPYTTSMIIPLKHCPACGMQLKDLIEGNPDAFDALAERQRIANPDFSLFQM
ncbi:MAG: hypothetical protein F9K40_02090 [Kofleriaceae bacterium]|nr:MAG: hypothetical protein F9K40_02090 [Kofleriaceae bacterium]MBZ0233965.1 hypothetical protein [Kofleriaceae bacterium]